MNARKVETLPALREGAVVAGRFLVERLLAEGGMGAVWAARHVLTKRHVAIKVLRPPASLDLVQRFVREARAANAVHHPNVVQVHDVFDLDDGLREGVIGRSSPRILHQC